MVSRTTFKEVHGRTFKDVGVDGLFGSLRPARLTRTDLSEVRVGVVARLMAVVPDEVNGIATDGVDGVQVDVLQLVLRQQWKVVFIPMRPSATAGAGTSATEIVERIDALVAVVPDDLQLAIVRPRERGSATVLRELERGHGWMTSISPGAPVVKPLRRGLTQLAAHRNAPTFASGRTRVPILTSERCRVLS